MRLFEFTQVLLEYNRNITQQKLGDKLVAAATRDRKQDIDTILNTLEQIDPTQNKQYTEWLCKQYISGKFRLEDYPQVNDVLVKFGQVKNRLQQRDINKYTFHSLEDAMDEIYNAELNANASTNNDLDSSINNIPNLEILYNGPFGYLVSPETKEAAQIIGAGTKWCTSAEKNNKFDTYAESGPLYIWKNKNGEKYQFYFGDDMEFSDSKNRAVEPELLEYFRNKHPILSKFFKKQEASIASDPRAAVEYAVYVIKGRWPEAEASIATDPRAAVDYAMYVIKGRWPETEASIATDPRAAASYAINILNRRWPETEASIATDPRAAALYAKYLNFNFN